MVQVDEALTRKVADLARLELSDAEVKTFTSQLGDILKYVDALTAVDVTGIEPMTHPLDLETPMRDDVARAWPPGKDGRPRVLESAPESVDDGFKVPPVL